MKGKMSKKALVILAAIGITVLTILGVTLAAVNHHKPLISLNKSVLELDVTDTYELEAKVEKAWTKPKWSSEDESIATVSKDGVVTAVKEGRTKVTLTSGKTVANCEIVVTDSQSAPRIELDFNNVAIGLNYTFTVTPKMMWKGEEVKDKIKYTWELNEDAADDIASFKQKGSSAVITGLKYGDTSFKVSATYRDTVLVKTINVCVTNIDVMYESPNMIMSDGCFRVNLGLVETEKDVTSIVPEIKVYDKEELVENPTFTWTNSDETVAVRDDSGRITAKKAGDTEITGLYKDSPLLIRVHVYRPEIEIEPIYVEAFKNFAISSYRLSGMEVESVTFSEKEVMKGAPQQGPTVQLDEEKLPAIGTSGRLVVQTEKVRYVSDSMVVSMAIYNESDLNRMPSVIRTNKGAGYYAVAQDITCAGKYDSNLDVEFVGTFDGCGHTIKNMTTSDRKGSNRGLLGKSLGNDGVVKNVSFINAKHGGQGAFIVTDAAGKMENVFVQIDITDCSVDGGEGATSVLASNTFGVFQTKSVIVEYMNDLPEDATTGYAIWQMYYGYAKHQGFYVIGADKNASSEDDLQGGLKDIYGAYANYGEFIDAGNDVSTWDEDFWRIINGIPYPKNLGIRVTGVPKVTLPQYVGTGTSVKLDGMTICDRVITNSTMRKYGIKVRKGYLVIPDNVPSGTVLNITIQSAFDASKVTTVTTTVLKSEQVTMDDITAVELYNSKKFDVNLKAVANRVAGATLVDVTINGKTISGISFRGGKLTLNTNCLDGLGVKTLQAYFKNGSKLIIVTAKVDACTMAIKNEADLNKMASVIHKNKGEGRYVLANDIKCVGTYDANINDEFNGTFEGHGYTIYNMTTSSRDGANRGLLGASLGQKGVVKNTSFVNAKHSGKGAFIVSSAAGTMENLYIQIAVDNCSVDSYEGATSVLASATYGVFSTRNVIVEYMNRLPNGVKTGHAIWQLYYGYEKYQGLYVIGEDRVATQTENLGGGLKDTYGAYLNYGEYIKANISTKIWDRSFWNVTNNVPYPKRLGARTGSVPKVVLPTYVGMNSSIKLDGLTICDEVVVNNVMKQYGIKVKDGYLIIPKNVPSGTSLNIVIRSAFDHSKKTTVKTTVMSSTKAAIKKIYAVELDGAKTFDLNLDGENSLFKNGKLVDVTIAGKNAKTSSYADNILTLEKADIDGLGEKKVEAYFKVGNQLVIATITIDACTLAIENEEDLNKMASVIHENGGEGRYVLANDIQCQGTYDANISDEFNGIFEGHGYVIYNMQTSSREGINRGLLGASLGSKGIVRNVSFVNAKHGGQGAFIATSAAGTMENVYIQIAVTDCNANSYEWATSVLASTTFGVFNTKNVIVEYMNPLPDGANTGYALWQLHYGYAKHQGLYVVGADKVASQTTDLGGGYTDIYAAHMTYGDFVQANHDLSGWNNDFWAVKYNVPSPKRVEFAAVPEVSIPATVEQSSETEITGLTLRETVILADEFTALGIKVEGNKLIVPETVPADTEIELNVQNVFDAAKVKTLTTKVVAPSEEQKKISWSDFKANGTALSDGTTISSEMMASYSGSLNNTVFEGDVKIPAGAGFRYGTAIGHFGLTLKVNAAGQFVVSGGNAFTVNGTTDEYTFNASDYDVVGGTFNNARFTLRIEMYDMDEAKDNAKAKIYINGKQAGEEYSLKNEFPDPGSEYYPRFKIESNIGFGAGGLGTGVTVHDASQALTKISWSDFKVNGTALSDGTKISSEMMASYSGSLNGTAFEGDVKIPAGAGFRYGTAIGHFGLTLKVNAAGQFVVSGVNAFKVNGTTDEYTFNASDYDVDGGTFTNTRFTLRIEIYDMDEAKDNAKAKIYINGKQAGEEYSLTNEFPDPNSEYYPRFKIESNIGFGAGGLGTGVTVHDVRPALTKISWSDFKVNGTALSNGTKISSEMMASYSGSLNDTVFEGDVKIPAGAGFRYGTAIGHFGLTLKVNAAGQFVVSGGNAFKVNGTTDEYTFNAGDYDVDGGTFTNTRFTLRIEMYDIDEAKDNAKAKIYINGKRAGGEYSLTNEFPDPNSEFYSRFKIESNIGFGAGGLGTGVTVYDVQTNSARVIGAPYSSEAISEARDEISISAVQQWMFNAF